MLTTSLDGSRRDQRDHQQTRDPAALSSPSTLSCSLPRRPLRNTGFVAGISQHSNTEHRAPRTKMSEGTPTQGHHCRAHGECSHISRSKMPVIENVDVAFKNAGGKHGVEVAMLPHPLVAVADVTPATSTPALMMSTQRASGSNHLEANLSRPVTPKCYATRGWRVWLRYKHKGDECCASNVHVRADGHHYSLVGNSGGRAAHPYKLRSRSHNHNPTTSCQSFTAHHTAHLTERDVLGVRLPHLLLR